MIDFTNTVVVDRPVNDVYDYLSDLERVPDWNWAIASTQQVTPGPVRVGSRYRQARTVPQPATEMLEVVELEPNRSIGIEGTLAGLPARLRYDLEPVGQATVVRNRVRLVVRGALELAAPILSRRISGAVASNLNDLKTQLERTQSSQEWKGSRS